MDSLFSKARPKANDNAGRGQRAQVHMAHNVCHSWSGWCYVKQRCQATPVARRPFSTTEREAGGLISLSPAAGSQLAQLTVQGTRSAVSPIRSVGCTQRQDNKANSVVRIYSYLRVRREISLSPTAQSE